MDMTQDTRRGARKRYTSNTLGVMIASDMRERMEKIAEQRNVTLSQIFRDAVEMYVEAYEASNGATED